MSGFSFLWCSVFLFGFSEVGGPCLRPVKPEKNPAAYQAPAALSFFGFGLLFHTNNDLVFGVCFLFFVLENKISIQQDFNRVVCLFFSLCFGLLFPCRR